MLGQHPQIYAVPELNLFTVGTLVEMFDCLPSARIQGLVRTLAQLYCGEQTIESAETARRWIFRRLKRPTGEVHQELCRRVGPLRLIDPSGLHSELRRRDALERILDTYPDAHFLHLVRHPRAQGEAWLRNPVGLSQLFAAGSVDVGPRHRTPDPQIDWYRRNAALSQLLSDIPDDRRRRMRVEDILGDPRQRLRELTDWLDLDWSEEILEAMLHPERSPYSRPGPYSAEGGSDTSFLASPHYRRPTREPEDLKGALPWRPDGTGFLPESVALAHSFGYT
jgi:hypothetical protein